MRRFHCERCGSELHFTDARCANCGTEIGYEPATLRLRALEAGASGTFSTVDRQQGYWRCLNAAWGCNWLVPAARGDVWCRSCRLTRGRPDTADPAAVQAWMSAEAAKRRVVHQLDGLGLPVQGRTTDSAQGLVFDLVHVPGQSEVTGHRLGVITLDLTEANDLHRAAMQTALAESFRTLIGHLRHELGHYYMAELVRSPQEHDEFRSLFGDERADYAGALQRHYERPNGNWRADGFITSYAGAHPIEDWAETFAHYLAIRDGVETMVEHGLRTGADAEPAADWTGCVAAWQRVVQAMNAVAEGLGQPAVYPIELTMAVLAKLDYLDTCVRRYGQAGDAQ
ncbi:MAG: putative zinc-binding metallopeptidase [Acidimicrobiales bacterium]|nr:putative zinc-binding metallopeptidase [Acidimicrobiales bacterium]